MPPHRRTVRPSTFPSPEENIIQPGPIETDGNPADGESGDLLVELTALKRFGTTADVGALVASVASDAATFMTGSVITSDGGWTA